MLKLFAGQIRDLPSDNRPTGIFKTAVRAPVRVGKEGLAGDIQADRRVHGGPEKALHHYAAGNYARLAAAFPEASAQLVPGSLGENISVGDWNEASVCIGDLFRLGDALIQVSQPRTPCWKIDSRFGVEGMTRFIHETGLTGWYYRVIEQGVAGPGGEFSLIERDADAVTVEYLLHVSRTPGIAPEIIESIVALPALSANWVKKLQDRAQWLRRAS